MWISVESLFTHGNSNLMDTTWLGFRYFLLWAGLSRGELSRIFEIKTLLCRSWNEYRRRERGQVCLIV